MSEVHIYDTHKQVMRFICNWRPPCLKRVSIHRLKMSVL